MSITLRKEDITRVKSLGFLHNRGTRAFSGRIITVNGRITSRESIRIAEAAELYGQGVLTFTSRQTVEVPGIDYADIEPFRAYLAEAGLMTGGTGAKVRPIVSCKGTTCTFGLCDTFALSETVHHRFFTGYGSVILPHKFKIAVGGCPNNCVKPDLNDIGVVGQVPPVYDPSACIRCKKCVVARVCPVGAAVAEDGGVMRLDRALCYNCGRCRLVCPGKAVRGGTPGYKIYVGGRWGKEWYRGTPLTPVIASQEEALGVIESAILLFREKGEKGERFGTLVRKLGMEAVEEALLSGELLRRKEEILAEKA